MRKMKTTVAAAMLITSLMCVPLASAQEPPAIAVSPSKATMLVGDAHTFRAVGKDGRLRHNVRWAVSPERAATLTTEGDEATLAAQEPSSSVMLTAYTEGSSAQASIEIRSGNSLPIGTVKWSVKELPGCKTVKITPAVPSQGGPDIYVEESCPGGMFVRAIMEDGRELWRKNLGGAAGALPASTGAKEEASTGKQLNLSAHSVCDAVTAGMTKDAVAKLAQKSNIRLTEKERATASWTIEEPGFLCKVSFDDDVVATRRKTITTE